MEQYKIKNDYKGEQVRRVFDIQTRIMFEDNRSDSRIGEALTGVYYEKTPIVFNSQNDTDGLKFTFMKAFEAAGFVMSESSDNILTINLQKLWLDEVILKFQPEKARCNVELSVTFQSGKSNWKGNYWTTVESEGDLKDGSSKLGEVYKSCVSEIVNKVSSDKKLKQVLLK